MAVAQLVVSCLQLLLSVTAELLPVPAPDQWVVLEGQGIQYVARLGDPVYQVQTHWGLPARTSVHRTEPGTAYEYPGRGAVIQTDDEGRILSFTFYCDSPGGYQPFAGRTARGFTFSGTASVEALYAVYGEPARVVDGLRHRRREVEDTQPYRLDFAEAGSVVVYPVLGWSCATLRGRVVSCTVSRGA